MAKPWEVYQSSGNSRGPWDAYRNSAQEKDEGYAGAGIVEPALAIGSGALSSAAGGIAGLAQSLNPFAEEGAGAKTVESFQQGAFTPKTQAGKEGMQTLADLVKKGVDLANIPLSGLGGILEVITGQGFDKGVETIRAIQNNGVGVTLGDRALEETGSPLIATAARVAPEAVVDILGMKGAGAALKSPAISGGAGKAVALFTKQSPTKQKIGRLIEQGSTDAETARYTLADPSLLPPPKTASTASASPLKSVITREAPKIVKDPVAISAIDMGFDEGVIAAVKGASPTDKAKMLKMVDIMEQGKKNNLFAMKSRPTDVAGDSLMERLNKVKDANRSAGSELDGIAGSLRGKPYDITIPGDQFMDDLDAMGITLERQGSTIKANFSGSDIEGLAGPESAINRIISRISKVGNFDAYEAHRLKRFIDETVTFGKNGEGLAGKTEAVLKKLRKNLDKNLDENFPEYNRVNTQYAETIDAIDAFQDVAGSKMNLTADSADKATGTLLRRLMSNAQSRVRMLDAVQNVEDVAKKYGGKFDDDLFSQVLFADELDSVFGPTARTSFQGQIRQAIPTSKTDAVMKLGEAAVKKVKGVTPEKQYEAIRALLNK